MKKIILGLLFVVLTSRISFGIVNYIPAFVGYALIFLGLGEGWDSPTWSASRTIAVGAAVVSAILWGWGLLGNGMIFPVEETLRVLVTYRLLRWCEEQEDWEWGFRIQRLRLSWYGLLGATVAGFVMNWLNPVAAVVWNTAAMLAGLYYTYTFHRLRRLAPAEFR